ncbi:pyridoxal phosphate-dependent decarboxylase family protein [Pseudemcibacter aquimaris]|uniref:pyridoxal phosphate-dependent decarboxylase family protein n=1 Tax=Pseudemcibacter aquimaris TaxID=2857064 RepID=UPI0020138FAC|nr:aminotransferase class V-fold PLP-dependent enzyme [Pseudemcibacter aquimaris]MCC3862249.1 aminotransferase class V-fold PLP-dependent enzyme [Pseudemcibacter aquimaris]WDU59001.1 aminotransferase class V-fold PLP-dependent enzyme [Pseudemcibacter aquimaris]
MTKKYDFNEPESLNLPPGQMKKLGYQVIDMIVDHIANIEEKPVHNYQNRSIYNSMLETSLPENGMDPSLILEQVDKDILTGITHTDHPRFYGYVPGSGNFISTLADAISSGFNIFAGHSFVGSSAAAVEAMTLDWLRQLMNFPIETAGVFVSGGSMANLTALHAARTHVLGSPTGHDPALVVYGTCQTHSTIKKALKILGFSPNQYKVIPVDEDLSMKMDVLRITIKQDIENGLKPFVVIATAGTTSSGAIDPLYEMRAICDQYSLWMHVDGAYGAAAYLTKKGKKLLAGLEMADSLALDPHKWLFQPYEIGCLLVRNGHLLKNAFSMEAEYLREAKEVLDGSIEAEYYLSKEINFFDYGPQLTRSFRALKLWMFFKTHGVKQLTKCIERGILIAEEVAHHINISNDWEIVTKPSIGVLNFRSKEKENRCEKKMRSAVEGLLNDGFALITTTEIYEEKVFRLCLINPNVKYDDVIHSLNLLASLHIE